MLPPCRRFAAFRRFSPLQLPLRLRCRHDATPPIAAASFFAAMPIFAFLSLFRFFRDTLLI